MKLSSDLCHVYEHVVVVLIVVIVIVIAKINKPFKNVGKGECITIITLRSLYARSC